MSDCCRPRELSLRARWRSRWSCCFIAPHLTEGNYRRLLDEAIGKTSRQIEQKVAALVPKPPVPDSIRKLASRVVSGGADSELRLVESAPVALPLAASHSPEPVPSPPPRPSISPLAEDLFKVQFSVNRAFRSKLEEAQALLGRGAPDLAHVFERA